MLLTKVNKEGKVVRAGKEEVMEDKIAPAENIKLSPTAGVPELTEIQKIYARILHTHSSKAKQKKMDAVFERFNKGEISLDKLGQELNSAPPNEANQARLEKAKVQEFSKKLLDPTINYTLTNFADDVKKFRRVSPAEIAQAASLALLKKQYGEISANRGFDLVQQKKMMDFMEDVKDKLEEISDHTLVGSYSGTPTAPPVPAPAPKGKAPAPPTPPIPTPPIPTPPTPTPTTKPKAKSAPPTLPSAPTMLRNDRADYLFNLTEDVYKKLNASASSTDIKKEAQRIEEESKKLKEKINRYKPIDRTAFASASPNVVEYEKRLNSLSGQAKVIMEQLEEEMDNYLIERTSADTLKEQQEISNNIVKLIGNYDEKTLKFDPKTSPVFSKTQPYLDALKTEVDKGLTDPEYAVVATLGEKELKDLLMLREDLARSFIGIFRVVRKVGEKEFEEKKIEEETKIKEKGIEKEKEKKVEAQKTDDAYIALGLEKTALEKKLKGTLTVKEKEEANKRIKEIDDEMTTLLTKAVIVQKEVKGVEELNKKLASNPLYGRVFAEFSKKGMSEDEAIKYQLNIAQNIEPEAKGVYFKLGGKKFRSDYLMYINKLDQRMIKGKNFTDPTIRKEILDLSEELEKIDAIPKNSPLIAYRKTQTGKGLGKTKKVIKKRPVAVVETGTPELTEGKNPNDDVMNNPEGVKPKGKRFGKAKVADNANRLFEKAMSIAENGDVESALIILNAIPENLYSKKDYMQIYTYIMQFMDADGGH